MPGFFGKLFKKKDSPDSSRRTSDAGLPPAVTTYPEHQQQQQQQKQQQQAEPAAAAAADPWDNATDNPSRPRSRATSQSQTGTPPGESEFARSAREAARRGLKAPAREIDENTALSSLTDAEIVRLMEGMEGQVLSQPLITGPVPLLAIKKEYLAGSPQVLRKLEWLEENGWDQVWRARGDGDCFYRSFTLAYLLRILYAPQPAEDAARALSRVDATLPAMRRAGFQPDLLNEFLEPFLSVIASFVDPPPGQEPTEYSLLQVLQNAEKSNCIVVALRLMTGAYIRTHPDDFAPFLFSPVTLEPVTPDAFCAQEVEPCGREADNAQIMALAAALETPIRVAYLDRSEAGSGVINWVEFEDAKEENRPLTLLYRPGHFDVVAKDKLQAALVDAHGTEAQAAQDTEAQAARVRADAAELFAPVAGPSSSPTTTTATAPTETATAPAPEPHSPVTGAPDAEAPRRLDKGKGRALPEPPIAAEGTGTVVGAEPTAEPTAASEAPALHGSPQPLPFIQPSAKRASASPTPTPTDSAPTTAPVDVAGISPASEEGVRTAGV